MTHTKVLGLDIGHAAIKTVLFRKGFGRVPTFLCRGTRYPTGLEIHDSTQEFGDFLRAFLKRHQLLRYPTIASIPGESVISRIVSFPFSNPQKILKTLPFELEPFVPFSIDDLVIDYHPLTTSSQQTQVLAVAVPKDILHQRMDLLTKVGLNVQALEVQSLALFNTHQWIYPNTLKNGTLLLDTGHTSTSLCLLGSNGIWGIRTVLGGIKDFAEHIPQLNEGTTRETERIEEITSRGLNEKDEGSESRSLVTEDSSWNRLLQSLRTTIHAYESQTHITITKTYLGGGGASMEGLPYVVESQLELPTVEILPARIGKNMHELPPAFLPALGLSVKPALRAKGSGINFKKTLNQAEHKTQEHQNIWNKFAVAIGVIVALVLLNVFATLHFKESRYLMLQEQLRSQFQEVFPHTKMIVNEMQQAQSAIIQDRRMLNFFKGNHTTVLQVLAELSQRLEKEDETEVQEVLIDKQTITVQATTRSFEAVERIKQQVSQIPWVKTLQLMDAQVNTNSKKVTFGLTLSLGTA